MSLKQCIIFLLLVLTSVFVRAQQADSAKEDEFSFHFQTTVIAQYKPAFSVPYTGPNSLLPTAETKSTVTATLYAGAKLWKNASVFIDPELSGGAGLSGVFGIADATNGESFRVGSATPTIYLARLFIRQLFPLNKNTSYQSSDQNEVAGQQPTSYFSITVGKVDVVDYFDDNVYSHDPRTQFMSWGLMDYGAWDYPANVRGYTPSVVLEYITPVNELRYALSLVPLQANGNDMNWDVAQASSQTLEYTRHYAIKGRKGSCRVLAFYTSANMGNYEQAIALDPEAPSVIAVRKFGNTKYGFGISADQALTKDAGVFLRASWNNGNNETWMFSEIDHTASAGFSLNGESWKRAGDNIGLAYVISGISQAHRDYLMDGGLGFMLGDGNLNYAPEQLTEFYYSAELIKNNLFLSGAYQLLLNPGYNADRKGPVSIFSARVHAAI